VHALTIEAARHSMYYVEALAFFRDRVVSKQQFWLAVLLSSLSTRLMPKIFYPSNVTPPFRA